MTCESLLALAILNVGAVQAGDVNTEVSHEGDRLHENYRLTGSALLAHACKNFVLALRRTPQNF